MERVAAAIVLVVWLVTPLGTLAAALPSTAEPVCSCPHHTGAAPKPSAEPSQALAGDAHNTGQQHAHSGHAHGEELPASPTQPHHHKMLPNGPAYAPCDDQAAAAMATALYLPGTPLVFSLATWFEYQSQSSLTAKLKGRTPTPEPPPPRQT